MSIFSHMPSDVHTGWETRRDCGTATKNELLWYFFPGDMAVEFQGEVIRTDIGIVPALHWTAALIRVAGLALDGRLEYRYLFTDASEWMDFRLADGTVNVSASFTPGRVSMPVEDFANGVVEFVERTVGRLVGRFPRLGENFTVIEMIQTTNALKDRLQAT